MSESQTVVLRLAAVMQAWGAQPRGSQSRPTSDHPTKSGVIGLVANICGRDWSDDISDLRQMRFAVRADRPGVMMTDYQIAGGGDDYPLLPGDILRNPRLRAAAAAFTETYSGHVPSGRDLGFKYVPADKLSRTGTGEWVPGTGSNTSVTESAYIADAVFTVALTGPPALVAQIAAAARQPARTPFLGRASCLPSEPLFGDITEHADPVDALRAFPLHENAVSAEVSVWAEVLPTTSGARIVADQPVDFASRRRRGRAELHLTVTPSPIGAPDLDFFE